MAEPANPFRPGFAEPPLVLAGRAEVLGAGEEAITVAVVDRRTPMPVMLVGPRGMGKTVMLDHISRAVGERHGWPRLWTEAGPASDLDAAIAAEAQAVLAVVEGIDTRSAKRLSISEAVLRAQVLGVGGELHLKATDAVSPEPAPALGSLIEALAVRRSGLVLVVDEAQAARADDLAGFASMLQRAVRKSLPVVTLVAGLPSLRRRTSESARSLGYLERADWHELSALSPGETRVALEEGAAQGGRPMAPGGSAVLVDASGGYPYAVQVYGKHAWRASAGAALITPAHARAALAPAAAELERNLYRPRWDQSPAGERAYLGALAGLGESRSVVTGRMVADRLGTTTRAASTTRARLLGRGTLVAKGEDLAFMVPGMAAWVRAQGPQTASVARGRARGRARAGGMER